METKPPSKQTAHNPIIDMVKVGDEYVADIPTERPDRLIEAGESEKNPFQQKTEPMLATITGETITTKQERMDAEWGRKDLLKNFGLNSRISYQGQIFEVREFLGKGDDMRYKLVPPSGKPVYKLTREQLTRELYKGTARRIQSETEEKAAQPIPPPEAQVSAEPKQGRANEAVDENGVRTIYTNEGIVYQKIYPNGTIEDYGTAGIGKGKIYQRILPDKTKETFDSEHGNVIRKIFPDGYIERYYENGIIYNKEYPDGGLESFDEEGNLLHVYDKDKKLVWERENVSQSEKPVPEQQELHESKPSDSIDGEQTLERDWEMTQKMREDLLNYQELHESKPSDSIDGEQTLERDWEMTQKMREDLLDYVDKIIKEYNEEKQKKESVLQSMQDFFKEIENCNTFEELTYALSLYWGTFLPAEREKMMTIANVSLIDNEWVPNFTKKEEEKIPPEPAEQGVPPEPKKETTPPEPKPKEFFSPMAFFLPKGEYLGRKFNLPPLTLLAGTPSSIPRNEKELKDIVSEIKAKLEEFGVKGAVVQINTGPVVTTFEFQPVEGIKYSKITSLDEDLRLALKVESVRITRTPGKPTVSIEVSNKTQEFIGIRDVMEDDGFKNSESPLTIAMGKDTKGIPVIGTIESMPHLLLGGSENLNKTMILDSIITSLACKSTPGQARIVLIGLKNRKLSKYEGLPHLLGPDNLKKVITDPEKAVEVLQGAVSEMERRLTLIAHAGLRNVDQYNEKVKPGKEEPLPRIVIVVDELADLMMTQRQETEEAVVKLAQMARAVGIHMVLATDQPNVDVVTGLIKANFPARACTKVATRVDSRTIIDASGAEHLLGKGDMLYLPPGSSTLKRIHGAFVLNTEIERVVDFWKKQTEHSPEQRPKPGMPTVESEKIASLRKVIENAQEIIEEETRKAEIRRQKIAELRTQLGTKEKIPEVETFSTKFIEQEIRKLVAVKKDISITHLSVDGQKSQMILTLGMIKKRTLASPLKVTGTITAILGNNNGAINITEDPEIEASIVDTELIKTQLTPELDKISETLKAYIEKQDKQQRKVAKMEIENRELKVTYK